MNTTPQRLIIIYLIVNIKKSSNVFCYNEVFIKQPYFRYTLLNFSIYQKKINLNLTVKSKLLIFYNFF